MNAHAPIRAALPDAIEAEQALLGAILVNNDAYWRVAGFLKPMHFTEDLHQRIYETAGTMIAQGRSANPVTIKTYLPADQVIADGVTVGEYLARLCGEAVTVVGAYDYGRAIIEVWARRQLIAVSHDLDTLARSMPVDRQGRKGERCAVTARGKMNSIRVVFADGYTMITSGNAIRRAP